MVSIVVVAVFATAALTSVDGIEYLKDICKKMSKAVQRLNKDKIIPTHEKAKFNTVGLSFHGFKSEESCTDNTETFIKTAPIETVDADDNSKLSQTTLTIKLGYKIRASDRTYSLSVRPSRGATCTITSTPPGSIDLKDVCVEDSPNWKTFMAPIEGGLSLVMINNKVGPKPEKPPGESRITAIAV